MDITCFTCTKCGLSKPMTLEFFPPSKCKRGFKPHCKACAIERARKWYAENHERGLETIRRYDVENRAKVRAAGRRHYAENTEKRKANVRRWLEANPTAKRVESSQRRAKAAAAGGSYSRADLVARLKAQAGLCWWCRKPLVGKAYHADHIIPLSKGGSNAASNICCACPTCNLSKGPKMPYEFAGRLF